MEKKSKVVESFGDRPGDIAVSDLMGSKQRILAAVTVGNPPMLSYLSRAKKDAALVTSTLEQMEDNEVQQVGGMED